MLALDHLVYSDVNTAEVSTQFGKQLSIKAIKGGEHEEWGTNNYLAYFSNDSYLEWLRVHDQTKADRTDNPLIKHLVYVLEHNVTGPFQFALRTDQMDKYISHFKEQNIPFKGPFPGHRERPDGTQMNWRMLFPDYDYKEGMLPFLIEWELPRNKRTDTSLLNPQAITEINYGGIDRETFRHIYQLKPRKLLKKQFSLQNAKIIFTDNPETFTFKIE